MKHLVLAALAALTLGPRADAQNMKYYVSDTNLRCARGDFNLELKFDGTGDVVYTTWNGEHGQSKVKWTNDQAEFDLENAVNGPFTLTFKNSTFYFLDVACTEFK